MIIGLLLIIQIACVLDSDLVSLVGLIDTVALFQDRLLDAHRVGSRSSEAGGVDGRAVRYDCESNLTGQELGWASMADGEAVGTGWRVNIVRYGFEGSKEKKDAADAYSRSRTRGSSKRQSKVVGQREWGRRLQGFGEFEAC